MIESLFNQEYNVKVGYELVKDLRSKRKASYYMSIHEVLNNSGYCNPYHIPIKWVIDITQNTEYDLQTLSPYYNKALHDPNTEFFMIVRNPFNRWVSEYKYIAAGHFDENYHHFKSLLNILKNSCGQQNYLKKEKCLQLRWDSSNSFELCSVENFNTWSYVWLRILMDQKAKKVRHPQEYIFDCHWIPQSEYMFHYENKTMNHVLKTEQLSDDLIRLFKDNGFTQSINQTIIDKYTHSVAFKKVCNNLTVDDLNEETR
eukprot:99796_1